MSPPGPCPTQTQPRGVWDPAAWRGAALPMSPCLDCHVSGGGSRASLIGTMLLQLKLWQTRRNPLSLQVRPDAQRLGPCCVRSPALTLAACARAAPHPAHAPGNVGCTLSFTAPLPHPQRGKEGISPEQEEVAVLARDSEQGGSPPGAGSGWWQPLCRAGSRTQSNRCNAGATTGGSHYFGLGHFLGAWRS